MGQPEAETERIHVYLHDYQIDYLRSEGYNISAKLRKEVDEIILEDGEDPEIVKRDYESRSR